MRKFTDGSMCSSKLGMYPKLPHIVRGRILSRASSVAADKDSRINVSAIGSVRFALRTYSMVRLMSVTMILDIGTDTVLSSCREVEFVVRHVRRLCFVLLCHSLPNGYYCCWCWHGCCCSSDCQDCCLCYVVLFLRPSCAHGCCDKP